MASLPEVNQSTGRLFSSEDNLSERASYRRAGLLNGLVIGLALVAGAWGLIALSLIQVPVSLLSAGIATAAILIILLCGLAGWLTAKFAKTWVTLVIWLITAFLCVGVMAFQSTWIRTLVVWLADPRFWGRSLYPASRFPDVSRTLIALTFAGFFVYLIIALLAILQDGRLESIRSALGDSRWLSGEAIIRLLLPMPFIVIAGLITIDFIESAEAAKAIPLIHEVIQTGRTYEGDLFELSQQQGVNYSAIRGVRDQLNANYELSLGEVNDSISTSFIVAHFDNGAWINCRVLADQLNFCYDASPPYTLGLSSLLSGDLPPEDCLGCLPGVDEDLAIWLKGQGESFSGPPQVTRLAQRGSHVLMRAESPDGSAAVECWFEGNTRVQLVSCSTPEE